MGRTHPSDQSTFLPPPAAMPQSPDCGVSHCTGAASFMDGVEQGSRIALRVCACFTLVGLAVLARSCDEALQRRPVPRPAVTEALNLFDGSTHETR